MKPELREESVENVVFGLLNYTWNPQLNQDTCHAARGDTFIVVDPE